MTSDLSPDERQALAARIAALQRQRDNASVDVMPAWRRQLVWEYGVEEVNAVDANVPERALAQLQARRKAAQERLLIESALPIKAEDGIQGERLD